MDLYPASRGYPLKCRLKYVSGSQGLESSRPIRA